MKKNNIGTITIQCGLQKSVITIEEVEEYIMKVGCKFMPALDYTKTPTRDENFVGNITQMILLDLKKNGFCEVNDDCEF